MLCKNKRGALPETGAQEVPSEHVTTEQDFGHKEKRLTRARRLEREGTEESRCKAWFKHPQGSKYGQRVRHEKE